MLRRKFLEKGNDLTLNNLLTIARAYEAADTQAKSIENQQYSGGTSNVNVVKKHTKQNGSWTPRRGSHQGGHQGSQGNACYRCGGTNHFAKDRNCPAKGKKCNLCHKYDHFARCCKSKGLKKRSQKQSKVNLVDEPDIAQEAEEYAFTCEGGFFPDDMKVQVTLGGVPDISLLIDSGASCNIIDSKLWEYLKADKNKCSSRKANKQLFPYGSKKPLDVLGEFTAELCLHKGSERRRIDIDFTVIQGEGHALLGYKSAKQLGILQINQVDVKTANQDIYRNYDELFQGLGKLKNHQVKIHTDPDVRPVIQQVRRLPFSLRSKVENKLKELLREDVIEQVDGPTPWVSPIVVVPKPSGDIRICVDMRIPNATVLPEKHVIPTVDEVILDLNQSSYFSRIDVKMAYHQLEIEEASRPITAFATHMGVFRYKRLLFGLKSASEHCQKTIQQILQGCEGVKNISDDLIIHGSNLKQPDERLFAVLDKLKQSGLTLNKEKCQFRLNKLVFMGHVLSDKGVSITEERSKALMEARRPESVSEVRSFMGLVNFCGHFINDLASIAEPLTRLTRKDIPFKWGNDQEKAFNKLKDALSSPKTLAYFDGNAQTKVIADAGPVGLGGILVQEQNGKQCVICYASRSLTDVERRYSQTEKEALALVWACERFHLYLYGREFELIIDHKPLEYTYAPRSKPSARIERWMLRLQAHCKTGCLTEHKSFK